MKTRVLLTAAALALAAAAGNAQQTASDGLGTVHFPISFSPLLRRVCKLSVPEIVD